MSRRIGVSPLQALSEAVWDAMGGADALTADDVRDCVEQAIEDYGDDDDE